jgi:FkbM family methyltransferase
MRGAFEFGPEGCHLIRECIRVRAPGPPLSIRVRSLGNEEVVLRTGTTDCAVAWDTFVGRYHLPPRRYGSPQIVWDLGSNIGLTVAHYAQLFPNARIYGVEPSDASFALAEANTQRWRARINLVQCAAWYEDRPVGFVVRAETAAGGHVDPSGAPVAGRSINSLLRGSDPIDFMKMDIEGAEREVLRQNTEWASKVMCLKVEVHLPYSLPECCRDLEVLGFRVRPYRRHHSSVIGFRAGSRWRRRSVRAVR